MKVKDLIEMLKNNCHMEDEIEIYAGYCPEFGDCYEEDISTEEVENAGRYDSSSDTYIKTWHLV